MADVVIEVEPQPRPRSPHRLIAWIADPKVVSTFSALSWALIAFAGVKASGSPPTSPPWDGQIGATP